jgi:multicomponent Na+:H+ antiporter subunit C
MIPYIGAAGLMLVGIYILLVKDNLIKKIMGLTVFTNGIHLFLISVGYRSGGVAPIITKSYLQFSSLAVDPLSQALVLTSIVINISITAFALSLAVRVYEKHSTLNTRKVRGLKG